MSNTNYNPILIHAITNVNLSDIPTTPPIALLPGEYAQLVAANNSKVPLAFPKNVQMLICKKCRKKARYNLGHITINTANFKKDQPKNMEEYAQLVGYFRCKGCNAAGDWEITTEYQIMMMTGLLTLESSLENQQFTIGENRLFDGSSHNYATDAEEHLLTKISESDNDAFLWNRLANLYYKGGRADLATAAFEHSLSIDPLQMESLYSLGMIVEHIVPTKAIEFYHKVLVTASTYTKIDASHLRELLSISLRSLVHLKSDSIEEISIVPSKEIYEDLNIPIPYSEDDELQMFEGELNMDDLKTFHPLAELFMGERREELPKKKTYYIPKKKKPKQKKKRRK